MNVFATVIDGKTLTFQLDISTPKEEIERFKEALEEQDLQKLYEFEKYISSNSWTIFVKIGNVVEVYTREIVVAFEVQ